MIPHIAIPQSAIAEFSKKWLVRELALFGSIVREDFRPDSDVDILVEFLPEAKWSLFDCVKMQDELGSIFGRRVDLVSKRAILVSENWIRKKSILESARVVYAA